ncbi:MAG: hypothetical protein LLG40_06820 [Deltaproteobacteria bacterium]|nr:hypothetical protein [Deltaproteobacteria bacterium]
MNIQNEQLRETIEESDSKELYTNLLSSLCSEEYIINNYTDVGNNTFSEFSVVSLIEFSKKNLALIIKNLLSYNKDCGSSIDEELRGWRYMKGIPCPLTSLITRDSNYEKALCSLAIYSIESLFVELQSAFD